MVSSKCIVPQLSCFYFIFRAIVMVTCRHPLRSYNVDRHLSIHRCSKKLPLPLMVHGFRGFVIIHFAIVLS